MDVKRDEIRYYSLEASKMIDEIYQHLLKFTLSESSVRGMIREILFGLDRLEVFLIDGFHVDQRIGKTLHPPYVTCGIIAGKQITLVSQL